MCAVRVLSDGAVLVVPKHTVYQQCAVKLQLDLRDVNCMWIKVFEVL